MEEYMHKAHTHRLVKTLQKMYDGELPTSCNMCATMCLTCIQFMSELIENPPDMLYNKCTTCYNEYYNSKANCTVVNRSVTMKHKPICTKIDILKRLLELI